MNTLTRLPLDIRFKQYERKTRVFAENKQPLIIRIDGKAFHTWTSRLNDQTEDPFSKVFHQTMCNAATDLFKLSQNSVFAYTQSDEISILLKDWDTPETQGWFNNNIQKIQSVSSSIVTASFNYHFWNKLNNANQLSDLALFDARAFSIPFDEVSNYFIWRQLDCSRNSKQMLARHYYSQKSINKLSNDQLVDKLKSEHNVDWNQLDSWKNTDLSYTEITIK